MDNNQRTVNVLIIDDSLLLRKRMSCRMERIPGVEVVGEASNVQEGITAFRRFLPDVVVLDLQMPGGSGWDVLETIKKERPQTRVAIFTNYPLPQFRKKSVEAGAEWFFDKTTESRQLEDVLKELARSAVSHH